MKGTRRQAEALLAQRLNEFTTGRYVAPTIETVGSYAEHWLANIAPAKRSAVTIVRYRSIVATHIVPGLGDVPLQSLDGAQIDKLYTQLQTHGRRGGGGLSSMTLHHVHVLLGQILKSAVKAKRISSSPMMDVETAPSPKAKDVTVLDEDEIATLLAHLRGRWLYMPVLVAISTGMRRGELIALRWSDIDLSNGTLQVARSVEELDGELRFKAPKTTRSKRVIKLPAGLLVELKNHRKEQSTMRLKLGLGKDASDLVLTSPAGALILPNTLTEGFAHEVKQAGIEKAVRLHSLRHSHLSLLLKAGVPVHVVAARAGHARASTTLDTYAHILGREDDQVAGIADMILQRAMK